MEIQQVENSGFSEVEVCRFCHTKWLKFQKSV